MEWMPGLPPHLRHSRSPPSFLPSFLLSSSSRQFIEIAEPHTTTQYVSQNVNKVAEPGQPSSRRLLSHTHRYRREKAVFPRLRSSTVISFVACDVWDPLPLCISSNCYSFLFCSGHTMVWDWKQQFHSTQHCQDSAKPPTHHQFLHLGFKRKLDD